MDNIYKVECRCQLQIAAIRGSVLYEIFLDLQKAYDVLDLERCL